MKSCTSLAPMRPCFFNVLSTVTRGSTLPFSPSSPNDANRSSTLVPDRVLDVEPLALMPHGGGEWDLEVPPFRQEQCWKLAKPTYSWSRRPGVTRPLKKYYRNFQWGSIPRNTSHGVMKHAMCRTELGLRAAPARRGVGGAQTRARRRARARQLPHPGGTTHHPPSPISTVIFH